MQGCCSEGWLMVLVLGGAGEGWGCAGEGWGCAGSQGPGDDELGGVGDEPRCCAWIMRETSSRFPPSPHLLSQRFILPDSIFDLWPCFAGLFSAAKAFCHN